MVTHLLGQTGASGECRIRLPTAHRLREPGVDVGAPRGTDALLASTGHGSAMDIAGTGTARPDALLRSLRLVAGLS